MQPFDRLNQPLKRYLTLFYSITLGLAVVLALLAIGLNAAHVPDTAEILQKTPGATAASTQTDSPPHSLIKPTEIPPVPPTPNEVTPSALGVTSADLHGIQINLWHPWSGTLAAQLQSILDDYSRTNKWGITINATSYEGFGRLDEAVEAADISGTLPDILIDYGYQAQYWDNRGLVADLSPYVNDPVWGFTSSEQKDFIPAFWEEDQVQDAASAQTRRLGIPFYRSSYLMFYNQTWANALGFQSPPDTPQEFKQQACAAMEATTLRDGKSDPSRGGWLITSQPGVPVGWIFGFGGNITNPVEPGYLFDTPETQRAFEFIKDLVDNGCAWSETESDPPGIFARRGALFMVGSLFDIPTQQDAFAEADNLDEWVVIPFPSVNQPVVNSYGPSLIITRSNPIQQLAAWMVIKWLVYPHNQIDLINAIQVYPIRQSSVNYLLENQVDDTQWTQALRLLQNARSEPSLPSWKMVRWAVNDAMYELIEPKFAADQIPALLEKLDGLAEEISNQVH